MKRLRVTVEQIVDVDDSEHPIGVDVDAFHDSLVDDLLDAQGDPHPTSDTKFEYIPREIVFVKVEAV
jgi:hypothetical protein